MKDFKIDTTKIETGFSIPEGYFDTLSESILQKIDTCNEPKVVSIWQKTKIKFMAVAAVLLVAVSIPIAYNYYNSSQNLTTEIENYISYNTSVTDDDLAELMNEETIQKIDISVLNNTQEIEKELLNTDNIEEIITN